MANDIASLTQALVDKLLTEERPKVLMVAVEDNFDLWATSLFPILRIIGESEAKTVAQILVDAGYKNATTRLVRSYLKRVRDLKGIKTRTAQSRERVINPSLPLAPTAGGVRSGPGPASVAPSPPARGVLPGAKVQAVPVAPVVPAVAQVDVAPAINWKEEKNRLNAEYKVGYEGCPWGTKDDLVFAVFQKIAKDYRVEVNKIKQIDSVKDSFSLYEDKSDCYSQVLYKRKKLGLNL